MSNDFIIENHPWKLLLESATFPDENELAAMKSLMDGEKGVSKNDLATGMKKARVKNLYELIVWGLRSGVIKDEPLTHLKDKMMYDPNALEGYPTRLRVLAATIAGYNDFEIQKEAGVSKDSLVFYRKKIATEFNLGDSVARLIRFGFQVLNPIKPPSSISKPPTNYQTIKNPPVLSKFRPANIDPNITVYDRTTKRFIKLAPEDIENDTSRIIKLQKLKNFIKRNDKIETPEPPRTTTVQTALYLLGIDRSTIYSTSREGGKETKLFWERSPDYLWRLLELAKRRYELEIKHAHNIANKGGSQKRTAQLNTVWALIREMFARRGYKLDS
jgi:hypothetical protein